MKKSFILSDSVESLLKRWPGTIHLFIRNQMACPGCYLAEFESLEGALHVYQVTPEPFLGDLLQIIMGDENSENQEKF